MAVFVIITLFASFSVPCFLFLFIGNRKKRRESEAEKEIIKRIAVHHRNCEICHQWDDIFVCVPCKDLFPSFEIAGVNCFGCFKNYYLDTRAAGGGGRGVIKGTVTFGS